MLMFDRALAQAVGRFRPLAAEGRRRFRSVYMGFVVDKVALGQVSVAVPPLSPDSIIPPMPHALPTANIQSTALGLIV